MKILEEPDIDTQDYVYVFKNLNGTSEKVLDKTLKEMYVHMKAFSNANGINEFCTSNKSISDCFCFFNSFIFIKNY